MFPTAGQSKSGDTAAEAKPHQMIHQLLNKWFIKHLIGSAVTKRRRRRSVHICVSVCVLWYDQLHVCSLSRSVDVEQKLQENQKAHLTGWCGSLNQCNSTRNQFN